MATKKQGARNSAHSGRASSSDYSSDWARQSSLTQFFDHPQLRPQKERVDYEESESESESEHEDDQGDDHEQHGEEEAEEEDEVEIKPEEDDSLFVSQNERPSVGAREDREDSRSSTVETATPAPASRRGTQAPASHMSHASAPSTNTPTQKPKASTVYSNVLGKEHMWLKGHLLKFIDSHKATQVAHEDRFDALWNLRDIKLLEREKRGTLTTRTHPDPRSKKSDEEERRWIQTHKEFEPYLRGGHQKQAGLSKHMNTAKGFHDEQSDEDDEEPLPAKPEEQEDDDMPDFTETRTELDAAIAPAKRMWQIWGGQLVAYPPFEDDADPERWKPRERIGHWAAQEVVPAGPERVKPDGDCGMM